MKKILLTTALIGGFAWVHAQEPAATGSPLALPGTDAAALMEEGSLLPSASGSGLILYPPGNAAPTPPPANEPEPALPVVEPTPTPVPTPGEITKGGIEQIREAIRVRELKTIVLEDPEVQAQREGARCAKTEAGRCVWMRNFYTLLFMKMEKLDPTLHEALETQLYSVLQRYEQHKIRPSILIENVAELPGSHSCDHAPAKSAATPPSKEKHNKPKGHGLAR